jgi:hypothetical protein
VATHGMKNYQFSNFNLIPADAEAFHFATNKK